MITTSDVTATYEVLGTFEDPADPASTYFEVAWNGRRVVCVCTGSRQRGFRLADDTPAADDVQRLARAWAAGALTQRMIQEEKERSVKPHPGRIVRSMLTRGQHVGAVGTVKRVEINCYTPGQTTLRLLVDLHNGGSHWFDEHRVQVIGGFGDVNVDAIADKAAHLAHTSSWGSLARLLDLRP